MTNTEAKTCWEFWNCSKRNRENCLAYITKSGNVCWMFSEDFTSRNCSKAKDENILRCWDCPWFKNINPYFEDGTKRGSTNNN